MVIDGFTAQQRWQSLAAVIAGVFGVGVAFGALVPLIALRLERDGLDNTVIGFNAAMFPVAVLLMGPFLPRLIGRLGTLRSMYLGLGLASVGILLFPALDNLTAWFVLRFLVGAATAIHWVVSETWINTMATDRNRGQVMGVYATVLAAGFAIGPLLIKLTGIDGWPPFVMSAAAVGLAVLPLPFAQGVAPPMPHRPEAQLWRLAGIAPMVMLSALVGGFVDLALFVLLPVYAIRTGIDPAVAVTMLTLFIAGNVVLQIPLGMLADRTDRWRMLLLCAAVVLAGACLLPVLTPLARDPGGLAAASLWAMLFFWGGAAFGIYTLGLGLLGERFPRGELAAANTAFVMVYEIGSISGPIATGAVMDLWSQNGLVLTVAAILAAFLLAGARSWSMRRR